MNGYLALALQLFALLLVAAILGVLVGHYLWRPRTTTPAAPLLAAPPVERPLAVPPAAPAISPPLTAAEAVSTPPPPDEVAPAAAEPEDGDDVTATVPADDDTHRLPAVGSAPERTPLDDDTARLTTVQTEPALPQPPVFGQDLPVLAGDPPQETAPAAPAEPSLVKEPAMTEGPDQPAEVVALRDEVTRLQAEMSRLETSAVAAWDRTMPHLESQISELEQQVTELQIALRQSEGRLAVAAQHSEELQQAIAERDRRISALTSQG